MLFVVKRKKSTRMLPTLLQYKKPLRFRALQRSLRVASFVFPALLFAYFHSFGGDDLCRAAYAGNNGLVRILLILGVPPDSYFVTAYPPLEAAVLGGQVSTARLLLDSGADPNTLDEYDDTAIQSLDRQSKLKKATPAQEIALITLLRAYGGH